jgi:hypothetical protein
MAVPVALWVQVRDCVIASKPQRGFRNCSMCAHRQLQRCPADGEASHCTARMWDGRYCRTSCVNFSVIFQRQAYRTSTDTASVWKRCEDSSGYRTSICPLLPLVTIDKSYNSERPRSVVVIGVETLQVFIERLAFLVSDGSVLSNIINATVASAV